MTITTTWHNCYDGGLKGLITPASFAHPAKMARRLCERILEHGHARGYWKPGDLLLDPFAGIFTTGLVAAYRGYHVIGIELEQKFFDLANENIAKNAPKLSALGRTLPVILKGDSRNLIHILRGVAGAITSPPYADTDQNYKEGWTRFHEGRAALHRNDIQREANYGDSHGQLSELPSGDIDAIIGAITSPPYGSSNQFADGEFTFDSTAVNPTPRKLGTRNYFSEPTNALGQIGNMPVGAISSPPYAQSVHDGNGIDPSKLTGNPTGQYSQAFNQGYGASTGQLGAETGDTYWAAVAAIYTQLFHLLPSGGALAIVVKDYVKQKQIVPLCDQTALLLQAIGFVIPERIHAMLVKERTDPGLFGPVTKKTSRKSFFRRLAERKGSPEINFEEVIWAIKP